MDDSYRDDPDVKAIMDVISKTYMQCVENNLVPFEIDEEGRRVSSLAHYDEGVITASIAFKLKEDYLTIGVWIATVEEHEHLLEHSEVKAEYMGFLTFVQIMLHANLNGTSSIPQPVPERARLH